MDFNGPPRWEHLLARLRGQPNYNAGGFFGPLNEVPEHPHVERPEDDRAVNNPPLHPDDQEDEEEIDVVGLDHEDVLERGGGDADGCSRFDRSDSSREEESEEELDYDEDPHVRPPSPPPQQFPPPNFRMDWRQQPSAFHIPPYYSMPPSNPYAFPYAFSHAFPFAYPYTAPYAFPFIPPCAPPYVAPYAFPFIPAFASPFTAPYAFPFVPPSAPPYSAHAFHYTAPHYTAPYFTFRRAASPASPPVSEDADSGIDDASEDEENEDTDEDQGVPTSCGFSSTRRCREKSEEEEPAAKRPRWSEEIDSD